MVCRPEKRSDDDVLDISTSSEDGREQQRAMLCDVVMLDGSRRERSDRWDTDGRSTPEPPGLYTESGR